MIPELKRLNELARQPQLSEADLAERASLRKAYLAKIRAQVCENLAVMTVLDTDGRDVTPMALRDAQAAGAVR